MIRPIVLSGLLLLPLAGAAADPAASTRDADFNRRQAQYDAQAAIAPASVLSGNGYPAPETDFVALSMQIERLAAHLREQAEQNAPAAVPGLELPVPGSGVARHYGPDGPTVTSVRTLLDYRLMLAGKPELKAGAVVDEGAGIRVRIVGAGGVVVDEYVVEKASGAWVPVRRGEFQGSSR